MLKGEFRDCFDYGFSECSIGFPVGTAEFEGEGGHCQVMTSHDDRH